MLEYVTYYIGISHITQNMSFFTDYAEYVFTKFSNLDVNIFVYIYVFKKIESLILWCMYIYVFMKFLNLDLNICLIYISIMLVCWGYDGVCCVGGCV